MAVLAAVTAKPQYGEQPQSSSYGGSVPEWTGIVQQEVQQQSYAPAADTWSTSQSSFQSAGEVVSLEEIQRRWASFLPHMPWLRGPPGPPGAPGAPGAAGAAGSSSSGGKFTLSIITMID